MAKDNCVTGHSVQIMERGGGRKAYDLVRVAEVEWGRTLSGKSLARCVLVGEACRSQGDVLNAIAPRRHEMALFRGAKRSWEGSITGVETQGDHAIVTAADGKEYLDFTVLSVDWPNADGGGPNLMTERIAEIIDYELTTPYQMRRRTGGSAELVTVPRWEAIDPPANLLPYLDVRASTTLLTRSDTLAFEMMLGEHLDNLAEGGLDYTFVGRQLIIWDSGQTIGRLRTLTEADFTGQPRVILSGSDHFSINHISATRPEDDPENPVVPEPGVVPGVGNAGGEHDFYGVWTGLSSLSSEEGSDAPTQDELNSQASRGLLGRTPVPIEIRMPDDAGIRLSHDLTIDMLVPGVEVPVLAKFGIRTVSQSQRLTSLTVKETAAGETVSVKLTPIGDVTQIVGLGL